MSGFETRMLGAVLSMAMLCGCQTSSDGALPDEDRLLEDVMETYISERFRFYPVESTLAGLPGNDDRFGDYSRGAIDARIHWLVDFHHKLMGLRLKELSRRGYLDALWLTSLVKAELFELEERARWQRTAAFYVDPVRLGLVALLADADLSSRGDALLGRLADIPRVLANARENLTSASSLWRTDGLASLEACRALVEDLPDVLEGHLPPTRVAELAGLSRVATRAVQDFAALVPELQAADGVGGFALGEEALERYLFSNHMLDWPLDDVVRKAEERLSVLTHELTELALTKFPSRPLAALVSVEPIEGSLESAAEAAEKRVLDFVREREGAPAVPRTVPVRLVPAYFPGSELVQLWRPKALEPARGAFLMVRQIARPDARELELATFREVGARTRIYQRQSSSASLLRRVSAAPTTTEAWLGRFERRALDAGYLADRPEVRVEHYHRAILEVVRLLALIELHARGKSIDDVARLFAHHGLLSPADAHDEATRVAIDLSAADPALGVLLIEELASDFFRAHPLEMPTLLDDQILEVGFLPVRLLRFELGLTD